MSSTSSAVAAEPSDEDQLASNAGERSGELAASPEPAASADALPPIATTPPPASSGIEATDSDEQQPTASGSATPPPQAHVDDNNMRLPSIGFVTPPPASNNNSALFASEGRPQHPRPSDTSSERRTVRKSVIEEIFGSRKKSSVVLPDLSPHPVVSPQFDASFRGRLKSINERNRDDAREQKLAERDRILQEHYALLMERGEASEKRHRDAEALHQRLLAEKKWLENQQRTKMWTEVLVSTMVARRVYHELCVHHAFVKLRERFRPMLVRKIAIMHRRRARKELTAANLEQNPRPTSATLMSMQGDFFRDWSLKELDDLIQHMTPRSYNANEFIMLAGDFDREMYVLVKGSVQILIPDKTNPSKRRSVATAKVAIPKEAPAYFGEFALLCMEPRSASILCTTDCHVWVVSQASFAYELQFLSPQVAATLQAATDKRRKQNLQNYFPLRMEVLRRQPFLAHWSAAMLQELINELEPHVIRPDTVLFREGEYQPVMYIVGEGTVRLHKAADPSVYQDVGAGDCIGIFETLFTHERRATSAKCLTHTDLWSISRQKLINIAMQDPEAMLESRRIVQEMKAGQLTRCVKPAPFFTNDPYIQWFLTPHAQQLAWAEAEPRVYCTNEQLFREGEDVKGLFIIAVGTFSIRFSAKSFEGWDEEISVNPVARGVHSARSDSNDKIGRLFPAATLCTPPMLAGAANPPTSPTLMRLRSDVSAFIFAHNERRSSPPSPTHATASGSGAMIGVVVGAFELSSRRSRYTCSVRCLSQCDVWFIRREAVDAAMSPKLTAAVEEPRSISHVIDAHNRHDAASLYLDHPYKPSAHYNAHHNGADVAGKRERGNRGGGGGGGGGDAASTSNRTMLAPLFGASGTTSLAGTSPPSVAATPLETPMRGGPRRRLPELSPLAADTSTRKKRR